MRERRNRDTVRVNEDGKQKLTTAKAAKRNEDNKLWRDLDIAIAAGLGEKTVQRFFCGQAVDRETAIAICKALDLEITEILEPSLPNEINSQPPEIELNSNDSQTRWVGREKLISELIEKLQGNCRILSIVGITGIGKTSLTKQLAKQPQLSQKLPGKEVSFFQEEPKFQVVAERILGAELANSPQLQQNPEELVKAMVNQLKSQPILLILDMIEVILKPDGKSGHQFKDDQFKKFLDAVVLADTMLSRIVLTSQDRPPIMAEGRYPDRFFEQPLRGLSEAEAIALFRQWDVTVEGEKTQEYLKRIFAVYEGHPLALSAIAGEVRESPYEGNLESYWEDYHKEIEEAERLKTSTEGDSGQDKPTIDRFSRNLEDLVKSRIENTVTRLRTAYPLAFRLLCRGGKSRRAIDRVTWLLLIDEFPHEERELAWKTLERRFFLLPDEKSANSSRIFYRLHPLMRRVALDNLSELDKEVQPG